LSARISSVLVVMMESRLLGLGDDGRLVADGR
jgi:hypothetical protein